MSIKKTPLFAAIWATPLMALVIGLSGTSGQVATASQSQAAGRGAAAPQSPPTSSKPDGQRGGPGLQSGAFSPTTVREWWNDEEIKKEIALDEKKSQQIDDYYERRQRQLKPFADEYQKELEALNVMTRDRVADERTYEVQVTRVEAFRSRLLTSRQVMIYQMYRELRPEQYQKLREIFARPRTGRGGPPSK